jgi:predicted porin
MKMSIVACVALGTCATLARAQDGEGAAPAGDGWSQEPPVQLQAPADAGSRRIAVFTNEPAADVGAAPQRRAGLPPAQRAGGAPGFTLGRQYNFEYMTQPDVGILRHGGAMAAGNIGYPARTDLDGGVRYYSSSDHGLSGGSSWTVDRVGGDPVADRAWGLSVGADFGMLSLRAAHQNRHVAQVHLYDLAGQSMEAKNSIVAANVRMGWGTAYAAYSMSRGWGSSPLYNPDNPYGAGVASSPSTNSRDMLMGVAVPVTRSATLLASFIRKNDRDLANRDAREVAVGASYAVSRKTDFYAALSHTVNTNGAGILIDGAAHPSGSSAINVGMRHAF